MRALPPGVEGVRARIVSDTQYGPALISLIRAAFHRCWCSVFIVDPSPARDHDLMVYGILTELARCRWRGADVRLLIGGSRTNFQIAEVSDTARALAGQLRLPCRWLSSQNVRSSHVKMVLADDFALTGSHNWSGGALGGQSQDSVIVESPAMVAYLCSLFEAQWARAERAK